MLYEIKEGEHYSTDHLGLLFRGLTGWIWGSRVKAEFSLNESWLIPRQEELDLPDHERETHKVFGASENLDHHISSARFGVKEVNDMLEISAYTYRDGVRKIDHITYLEPDEKVVGVIQRFYTTWRLSLYQQNGIFIAGRTVPANPKKVYLMHRLYPYYGGDYASPVNNFTTINWK